VICGKTSMVYYNKLRQLLFRSCPGISY